MKPNEAPTGAGRAVAASEIVVALDHGPHSFRSLMRSIRAASDSIMTAALSSLAADGFVCQGRFDNPSTIVAQALAWERKLTARRVSYAVAGAWWCGMIPTMLKVEPLLRSQVKTPKLGDAASERWVSTILTLDPETVISYVSVC